MAHPCFRAAPTLNNATHTHSILCFRRNNDACAFFTDSRIIFIHSLHLVRLIPHFIIPTFFVVTTFFSVPTFFAVIVRRKSHFKWNCCTDFFCQLILVHNGLRQHFPEVVQNFVQWHLYYKRGEPYLCSAKAPVLDGSGSRR